MKNCFAPVRVLLIAPSSERFYVPAAPLGLASIAAALPEEVEVEGLDLNVFKWVHGLDKVGLLGTIDNYLQKTLLHRVKPDLIGVTVYQETLQEAVAIAGLARKYGILTVAGGIFPTILPDEMPEAFDLLVRGDGELPFRQIVEAVGQRKKGSMAEIFGRIRGISYRSGRGSAGRWEHVGPAVVGGERVAGRVPRREIFDRLNLGFHYYSARITGSRGCPYACGFCVNSEYARREWRARPVEDVMDEVLAIVADTRVSELSFSDDQFLGFKPEHYRRACRLLEQLEIIARKRNLRINLQVRADRFLEALEKEPELARIIRSISRNFTDNYVSTSVKIHGRPVRGFSLDIGAESFLDQRLTGFNKGLDAETNIRAIRKARELEVDLGVYMIAFTPEITLEQLREEFALYRREVIDGEAFSKASFFNFFQELIPYKGTRVYNELKSGGKLVEEVDFTGFKFGDARVAAFYVLYLNGLRSGEFESLKTKEEMTARIEEFFNVCAALAGRPELDSIAREVVCELKDDQRLSQLYQRLRSLAGEIGRRGEK